jgi:hypothetical protein
MAGKIYLNGKKYKGIVMKSEDYINRMKTTLPNGGYASTLKRPDGLATSIHRSDLDNCEVILTIVITYMSGIKLQVCGRNSGDWKSLEGVPCDFANFRYRVEK